MKKVLLSLSVVAAAMSANAQQRVPLFEVFTSSTCPPCKPGNTIYENVVSAKPAADYVSVKYQQDFPGNGDPYATSETVSRRGYYNVSGIPNMQIDGGWDQNAQSFTTGIYDQYRAIPATYKLSGSYTVNTTTKVVTARCIYTPLTAGTNPKLYVAIIEKFTEKNVKNNGETEFFNVVKKMVPTETGLVLPATPVNTQKSITQAFTFNGSYRLPANGKAPAHINDATEHSVESFDSLRVVAWIQGSDKQVYQAANLAKSATPLGMEQVSSSVNGYKLFPNPATTSLNVEFDMTDADNVSASLINITGAVVETKTARLGAGKNRMTFDTQNLPAGSYTMIIIDSKSNTFAQMVSVTH